MTSTLNRPDRTLERNQGLILRSDRREEGREYSVKSDVKKGVRQRGHMWTALHAGSRSYSRPCSRVASRLLFTFKRPFTSE